LLVRFDFLLEFYALQLADGVLGFVFLPVQIELFALEVQELRVVVALAEGRHPHAQVAQEFELGLGIRRAGC
jgi:hypothetical protein